MLKSHELAIAYRDLEVQALELKGKINVLSETIETRSDDPETETRFSERAAMSHSLNEHYQKQVEALKELREQEHKEEEEGQALMSRAADTSGWDAELRELHSVASRVSFMDVLDAASKETFPVPGSAFAEYREQVMEHHLEDKPGTFPAELLLPRDELVSMDGGEFRVITTIGGNAQVGQRTIGGRLFANGEAAFLGASFPSVGPGAATFPVVTSTLLGVSIADSTAETIAAGTISLKRFVPLRIQISYEYAIREALEALGMEAAFQADLRGALQSGLDNIAVDAAINDLTNPTAAASEATLSTYMALFSNAVDAKAAIDYTQVRALLGLTTYKHAYGLTIANIGTAFELLPRERIRASSHLAQSGTGDQVGIVYRTGGGVSRFLAPVWRRLEILRDPYTQAKSGNVELIGAMYANAGMTAQDTHDEVSIQIS